MSDASSSSTEDAPDVPPTESEKEDDSSDHAIELTNFNKDEEDEEVSHDVTLDMVRNDPKAFRKAVRKRFNIRMQLWALICKNTLLQRRSWCSNICQCLIPVASLLIILLLQLWVASLISESIPDSRYPPIKSPFTILVKPEDGAEFVPPMRFLYWQTDPNDLGNYTTGAGFLGRIPNTTATFRFLEYESSLLNIDNLDTIREREANMTLLKRNTKQDVDKELFDRFYDPPVYANAFEFTKVSVPELDFQIGVMGNRSLTRGRDLVGAMSLITAAIADSIPNPRAILNFLGIKKTPTQEDSNDFDLASLAGSLFYCLILHQLLPVFLSTIVYEKEHRLREMMKMMGLKMTLYWIVQYVWFYILYCCVIAFLVIGGLVLRFRFFTVNSPLLYLILFVLWGHTLIAMSFLLSVFFSKARSATITGYFLVLALSFVGSYCVDGLVSNIDTNQGVIFIISCVPSFALYRGLVYLGMEVSFRGPGLKISDATNSDLNLAAVYGFIVVEWFIMIALAFYLDAVLPSTYGVKKHPLFFLSWIKKIPPFNRWFGRQHLVTDEEDLSAMPSDVGKEHHKAHSDDLYALKVQSMVKQYEKKPTDTFPLSLWRPLVRYMTCGKRVPEPARIKSAVDNVSFTLKENECLGILGPNGAGKTSMISVLCGLFEATSGTAKVYDMELRDNISRIHMLTGVCPQHDVLWDNMTAAEHLFFYGRLKNLSGKKLKRTVKKALAAVRLTAARNKLAGKYSGGMKRRLSVAISLMGNPKVVFLDEPSTGLDPKSKRALWQVIAAKKKHCAIILTTHSMEEAEALCDRLMIMSQGKVKAIGVSSELKNRYGDGFKVTMHCHDESYAEEAANFVEELLPNAKLLNSLAGMFNWSVPKEGVVVSKVFAEMEKNKERLHIDDWGICNTSLEEVFHSIVADELNDTPELDDEGSSDEGEESSSNSDNEEKDN